MNIIFRIDENLTNNKINVNPILVCGEDHYSTTSTKEVLKNLKKLSIELNNDSYRKIDFVCLNAGKYDFFDGYDRETFYILVRLKNDIPEEILEVSNHNIYYNLEFSLLKSENTDKERSYMVYEVKGKLLSDL